MGDIVPLRVPASRTATALLVAGLTVAGLSLTPAAQAAPSHPTPWDCDPKNDRPSIVSGWVVRDWCCRWARTDEGMEYVCEYRPQDPFPPVSASGDIALGDHGLDSPQWNASTSQAVEAADQGTGAGVDVSAGTAGIAAGLDVAGQGEDVLIQISCGPDEYWVPPIGPNGEGTCCPKDQGRLECLAPVAVADPGALVADLQEAVEDGTAAAPDPSLALEPAEPER